MLVLGSVVDINLLYKGGLKNGGKGILRKVQGL